MRKKRIRKEVLIATWFILMFLLGLIARIDNDILSTCYGLSLLLLMISIKKRMEVK